MVSHLTEEILRENELPYSSGFTTLPLEPKVTNLGTEGLGASGSGTPTFRLQNIHSISLIISLLGESCGNGDGERTWVRKTDTLSTLDYLRRQSSMQNVGQSRIGLEYPRKKSTKTVI